LRKEPNILGGNLTILKNYLLILLIVELIKKNTLSVIDSQGSGKTQNPKLIDKDLLGKMRST
jgi:hypothetical protein